MDYRGGVFYEIKAYKRRYTSERRELKRVHFSKRNGKCEFAMLRKLEQSPSADDLQTRQHNVLHAHVRNQNVACYFSDVLQKAQVHVFLA